jgi:hypothetical protein
MAKRWFRVDPSDLLLEIVSVTLAILLAFAANAWNDERKTQQSVHDSLVNVRREIAANRATLVPLIPRHRRFHDTYIAYLAHHAHIDTQQFYDLFSSVAAHGFNPFIGESTAWDIARSLPSAAALPYDTRVLIEETYSTQSLLQSFGIQLINDLHVSSTDDRPNLYLPATSVAIDASDIVALESRLLRHYDDLLARLPSQ